MSRRGSSEGTIHRRKDGRWTAALSLGYQGGRRRRRYFYGKTRAEVARKLHEAQRTLSDGGILDQLIDEIKDHSLELLRFQRDTLEGVLKPDYKEKLEKSFVQQDILKKLGEKIDDEFKIFWPSAR